VSSWILKQNLRQGPAVCKPGHNVLHDFHDRLHRHPPATGNQIFQQGADLYPVNIAATAYPQISQITQIAPYPLCKRRLGGFLRENISLGENCSAIQGAALLFRLNPPGMM